MKPKTRRTKITSTLAKSIRSEYGTYPRKKLPSMLDLAVRFNISSASVWRIVTRKDFKNVD